MTWPTRPELCGCAPKGVSRPSWRSCRRLPAVKILTASSGLIKLLQQLDHLLRDRLGSARLPRGRAGGAAVIAGGVRSALAQRRPPRIFPCASGEPQPGLTSDVRRARTLENSYAPIAPDLLSLLAPVSARAGEVERLYVIANCPKQPGRHATATSSIGADRPRRRGRLPSDVTAWVHQAVQQIPPDLGG
jgi:hypothetical protein